jgi:hypothetical protein
MTESAGRQFARSVRLIARMVRIAKAGAAMKKVSSRMYRGLAWIALLTAAGGTLASCDTPIGVSPALQGTYRENALVTNPDGGGPQVVRWGPPEVNGGGGG